MMKKFIERMNQIVPLAFVCAALSLSGCAGFYKKDPDKSSQGLELVILHVNDTHSHIAGVDKYGNACFSDENCSGGLSRIASAIKSAKAANDNVIALDAGDEFQGTLFYSVNKWPMLADIDAVMPYDAMTLGNHEFDEGCLELSKFLEKVPFPVLSANLAPEKGCPLLKSRTAPYIIRKVRGVPVGIVGLANDEVVDLASACKHTLFTNAADTLSRAVKELEAQGVHHIVALTHIGLPADRKLAQTVDGVDVIVGGHTHSYLGPGSEEGPYPVVEKSPSGRPVLVVTAKRAAQYLGELRVQFDQSGVPASWSGAAKEFASDAPRDPAVSELVKKYAKTLEEYRSVVVGSHSLNFADGMDACREGDCLGGMMMADAMLEYGRPRGAVMALYNGGGVRAALPVGSITRGDILAIFPFGGTFVLREFSGEQIWEALEHGVSEEGAKGPRLLQTAGLRYEVDGSKPSGKRIRKADVISADGKASSLELKKRYIVVLGSYMARGGDGYAMLTDGRTVPCSEIMDADLAEGYLKKHSPLPMPKSGRIVRVK